MNDFISIFKQEPIGVASIDHYTYQAIKALNLAYPLYSKIVLAGIENVHHRQSILFKKDLIRGFRFEDEDNAKNVRKFLESNLRNQKEQPISFVKYLSNQLFHNAIYNCFFDQFVFLGDTIERMYPLSPKYMYVRKDYSKWWQIIPNSDFKSFEDVGGVENNTDFTKDMKSFIPFGDSDTSKDQILEFSGLSSLSDYYPDIAYIDELDDSILVNKEIGTYERSWIQQSKNFKRIMTLLGLDEADTRDREIISKYRRMIESEGKAGETLILALADPQATPIKFETPQQIQKENFDETKKWNRDKIFAGHGVNPTILGIETNESSLTSTAQGEALTTYLETRAANLIGDLETHYNIPFKKIDPNYNTKLILETYKFKDKKQESEIEELQIKNENALIMRDDFEGLNDLRKKNGKPEYSQDQFNRARNSLTLNTGLESGF